MATIKYRDIDHYIEQYPKEVQLILNNIRKAIKEVAPIAKEKISYNIPTFYQDKTIVQFAAYTKHIGIYPTPETIEAFREELHDYKTTKGTIQFPLDKEIPYDLIKQIVKYRIKIIATTKLRS